MKKTFRLHIIAALILTAAMSITACQKDPYAGGEQLASAPFTLSAVEDRNTYFTFPWTISKAGVTDSVNEDIDEMYVTKYNTVTLVVTPSGSGFQGVNVRSSNEAAVSVNKLDETHYDLAYVADGEADISVWNGSKKDEIRTTFHVKAQNAIYPKAAILMLDEGTENEKEIKATEWFIDERENFFRYYDGFINVHKPLDERYLYDNGEFQLFINRNEWNDDYPGIIHTIRFKTLEPENTSFRTMVFNATKYREFVTNEWKDYLQTNNLTTDWWDSWTGDYEDFNKTCFYARKGGYWSYSFSLCELSFKVNSPTGSPWCQTAVIVNGQTAW